MKYIIHIENKDERIQFAAELRKLLKNSQTYIPGKINGVVYKPDIGIKANITEEDLVQIEGLIERRGYSVSKNGGPK
jgi:hypothetical protein